jgi:hypothetical protein
MFDCGLAICGARDSVEVIMRVGLYPVVVVAAAALAVGCRGNEYKDYCDKLVACVGGNDKDKDACVDSMEGDEDVADDYDCGKQYDSYTGCLKNGLACVSGVPDESACDAQGAAFGECVAAASAAID